MQIGLLEDNPTIHEYLQTALELNGHHITIHTYGSTLLSTLFAEKGVTNAYPYDLLITDLHLPGNLSGWDVILHIRKKISPETLPIIIITGSERRQFEQLHGLFPDIPFIQKPFKLRQLLQIIETVTAKQSVRCSLP